MYGNPNIDLLYALDSDILEDIDSKSSDVVFTKMCKKEGRRKKSMILPGMRVMTPVTV